MFWGVRVPPEVRCLGYSFWVPVVQPPRWPWMSRETPWQIFGPGHGRGLMG